MGKASTARSDAHHTKDSANPAIPPAIRCVVNGTLGFTPSAFFGFDVVAGGGSVGLGGGGKIRSPDRPPPNGLDVDVDMVGGTRVIPGRDDVDGAGGFVCRGVILFESRAWKDYMGCQLLVTWDNTSKMLFIMTRP